MTSPAARAIAYGSHPAQFGELTRPALGTTARAGTVVIVHGGFWRARYDLSLGRPLAADLAAHGFTCWNLEYRRVGNGGGWPATFEDLAAGIDHLAGLDVDSGQVVAVGHSAGAHLAVWAAGRHTLPSDAPGAAPVVPLAAAVAQAGVLDLATAARTGVGATAVPDLMGAGPDAPAAQYALADPLARLPIGRPVLAVHSRADADVPYAQSSTYVDAALAAGDPAQLVEVTGDHFTVIDPGAHAWAFVRDALPDLLAGLLPAAAG